jgi:Predicted glycosyltransferases
MKISIIIPTHNRVELLKICLEKLTPEVQDITASEYEIIVTDDSTNSKSRQMIDVNFLDRIKWIKGPQKGPASNRNNGSKIAQGEWLMFIDDDCIPDKRLIKGYLDAIKNNPETIAFEGVIRVDRPKRHFLEESPINEKGDCFWSCNIMIKKDYYNNVLHGFDENFPFACEDVDIYARIKKDGRNAVFVKDAFVIHPWRIQYNMIEKVRLATVSHKYLYSKHPELFKAKPLRKRIRSELRFYLKDVLLHIIPYRGRGVITFIKAHIITNRENKSMQS